MTARRRRPAIKKSRRRVIPAREIKLSEVESLSDFVSFLTDKFDDKDDVLFRGQREDWPLLPKIARLRLRPGDSALDAERLRLDDFKLQALSFVDLVPDSDWEWLSVAQHYGMATRLLDWTSNALAALWFAVERPAVPPKTGALPPAVVWVLDPKKDDYVRDRETETPGNGTRTKVFRPTHIARRITAQSGWFTVHKYIKREKRFVPLEKQAKYNDALTKMLIPADLFSDVRYGLDRCGVNAASMLTDLAGLCQHIEWSHSLLDDKRYD